MTQAHSKPLSSLGIKKMRLVVRLVTLEGIGGILDSAEYLPRNWDWFQVWNDHLLGYFTLGNYSDPLWRLRCGDSAVETPLL